MCPRLTNGRGNSKGHTIAMCQLKTAQELVLRIAVMLFPDIASYIRDSRNA